MTSRWMVCVLALLLGCSEDEGTETSAYASKDLWLCRPDIEDDYCDSADLSTTELRPDGSMVVLDEVAPNPDAEVDCFYVYPAVNYDAEPGNTETLVPPADNVVQIVAWQAAPYRGVCRIFAPLYHDMTFATYFANLWHWERTDYFRRAYDDVVDAFEYYMRSHNGGRGFILIGGGSHGAHVLTRVLEDILDDDEELRAQLISAVLFGPGGRVQVLEGEVAGGSYSNIPLCTAMDQTGCVITFDANAAGVETFVRAAVEPARTPNARACVNPASIEGGTGTLAAYAFPRSSWNLGPHFPEGIDTAWVSYPKIYTSRCTDAANKHVLLVDLAPDYTGPVPMTPADIEDIYVANGGALDRNLHGVEPYISSMDLLRIFQQQITAWSND